MRGEHCIAGASVCSIFAFIFLIFANIGQINNSSVPAGIYMVQVNVEAYGNAVLNITGQTPGGLYDTVANHLMGQSAGLRQYYRWGLYNACGYQKDGSGICNSTAFAYGFEPLAQLTADTPAGYKTQLQNIIPDSTFKDNGWNLGLSHVASAFIFLGTFFSGVAFIFGVIRHRITFFGATICSALSALFLMMGAAMWTSIINKDAWISIVKVQYGADLGIYTTAGASLYLSWVAFAFMILSIAPYAISCCTFRK